MHPRTFLKNSVRITNTALVVGVFTSLFSVGVYAKKPQLIVQITVDQLRGDMAERYLTQMGKGGFRYLYDEGLVYKSAHHDHANTETIVGHATLATGATPAMHGMVGNVWFDKQQQRLVYNIEDAQYPLLSKDGDVNKKTEIDPTQRAANSSGRSPANIEVSTFSDELFIASNGKAKVFGVSVKDRGAVSMAGHMGKAFWFSKKSGEFVSSEYYFEQYPSWVKAYNEKRPTSKYENTSWSLTYDQSKYQFAKQDDQSWEVSFPGFGRTFPHQYGSSTDKYFTTFLTISPAGDQLTLDFAKAIIDNEALGKDEITDYLSVSFSSTDYVSHIFGPSSLEAEDNMLQLDKRLAELFEFIDKRVGLDKTLIVLSADHGAAEVPAYLSSLGMKTQVVKPSEWHKKPRIEKLKKRFGLKSLIKSYFHPYVYLDQKAIRDKGLSIAEVQHAVAQEINQLEGVAIAVASTDLEQGLIPKDHIHELIANNHNRNRSGDIYIAFEPHRFVADMEGLTVASTHGSPWNYDTFVPLVFVGAEIDDDTNYQRVSTRDIAVTLSALMGIKAPSGATGKILSDVLDD